MECGALPTQAAYQSARYFAALEIVTRSQALRHVLPVLFEKYLDKGGDLVNGDEFPLHHALLYGHFKIVKAVIYLVEKKSPQNIVSSYRHIVYSYKIVSL